MATYDANTCVFYDEPPSSPRQEAYQFHQGYTNSWLPSSPSEAFWPYNHGLGSWEPALLASGFADGILAPGSVESDYNYDSLTRGAAAQLESYEVDPSVDEDVYVGDASYTDEELLDLEGKAYGPQDYL
jgi:hypothetical protein